MGRLTPVKPKFELGVDQRTQSSSFGLSARRLEPSRWFALCAKAGDEAVLPPKAAVGS